MRWPTPRHKQTTFEICGYEPNIAQWPIHRSQATVLQIVGAEGAGKSYVTASEIVACVLWCKLVYLIGQTYENSHREFEYIHEALQQLGAVAQVNQPSQGSWQLVTHHGCRIVTLSVERGASAIIAKGEQPDIFVLCEAGIINSYSVLLASVRRATRSAGRVILCGTLKDNFGWYASLVDDLQVKGNPWQGETYSLPAWTNTYLYPGGRDDPEIKRLEAILPDDEFQRTVAAAKVPSRALIFPEFNYHTHVQPCPFDPSLPVHLWIDPGYFPSAYAVLAVQYHGLEVHQIDEIYVNHHTHQQVIAIAKSRPWWSNVERAAMDIAGKQHHANQSAEEVWAKNAGIRPHSRQVGILEGINRHRTFLKPARLFHDPKCTGTLNEYKLYKRHTDRDGNPTSDMPIDEHNHAMKAIAYGLVDRFGFVDRKASTAKIDFYGSATKEFVRQNGKANGHKSARDEAEIERMLNEYTL